MDIADLIEIALANVDERRVEIMKLEPADISTGAIGGLAQLVAELVDNATAFSGPEDTVRVTGLFDRDDYLISVSDDGVGIPEHLLAALNRALEDPSASPEGAEPRLGIQLVARVAARNHITVRLVPGVPGTTARVTVPHHLVSRVDVADAPAPEPDSGQMPAVPATAEPQENTISGDEVPTEDVEETVDLTRYESPFARRHVVAMSESARAEAEEFLSQVFGPLMNRRGFPDRPVSRPAVESATRAKQAPRPDRGERLASATTLRIRVPGENFSMTDDDPSTVAAEGAIDIRSALTRFDQGRRSAEKSERDH